MGKNVSNAATPIECIQKGGDPEKTVVWACGTCKLAKSSKEDALECCAAWVCDECGQEIKKYSFCEDCSRKKQHAKEMALYAKAKKVTYAEYTGQMLCCDHCHEYFWDLDSYLDGHQDDPDMRTWVWGTYETTLSLDAERIIADQLESQEHHEEAFDSISKEAITEMQTFFNEWLKKVKLNSYMEDNSIVVDIEKEVAEYVKEIHGDPQR